MCPERDDLYKRYHKWNVRAYYFEFSIEHHMMHLLPQKVFKRYQNLTRRIFLLILYCFIHAIPANAQVKQETIKIGFLVREANDLNALDAAQGAILEANTRGGYNGRDFELVVKTCEGPWGVTSKQAVALIYDDKVCMIVTAVDGRNAHLIEQVAAKSQVVMLSTLSSDPSLSRAYVPWYFRIIPDDKQQATALVEQIYAIEHAKEVAMFSFDNYDGVKSAEAFVNEVTSRGYTAPVRFSTQAGTIDSETFRDQSWDAVVLAGSLHDESQMIDISPAKSTFAFLNFLNFLKLPELAENVHSIYPLPQDYVYDGISIAIEAIIRFGPNPESIRNGFKDIEYAGKTGKIRFDNMGDRTGD